MGKLKKAAAFFMSLVLILSIGSVEAAAAENATVVQVPVEYRQSVAREVLNYVNALRTQDSWQYDENNNRIDVPAMEALTYDYTLEQIAMQRAAELALNYSHTRPNGEGCQTAFTGSWQGLGENIAAGSGMLETASEVYDAWLEENEDYDNQGHRRNMQESFFTAIGMGCVYYNGCIYWAMELGTPSGEINSSDPGVADAAHTVEVELLNASVQSASVDRDTITVAVGGSAALPAISVVPNKNEFGPENVPAVAVSAPMWTVGNASVAAVENGQLIGKTGGDTLLTAMIGSHTITITVKVEAGGNEGGSTPGTDEGGNIPGTDEGGNTPGTDEGGNTPGTDEGGNIPGTDEGGNTPGTDEGGAPSGNGGNDELASDDSSESDSGADVNVDWNTVNNSLNSAFKASNAQDIVIATGESTEIPADILSRLAGSKATLALQSSCGFTVTVSGRDVKKAGSALTVSISGSVGIPDSVKQKVVSGSATSREFTISDPGTYPIAVHMNLGKANAGKSAVLYYYDEKAGTMKSVGSFTITESGQAMFGVRRGGQYIAVVSGQSVQNGGNYTVVNGDTLYGIARKGGVNIKTLREANPQITDLNKIYPGQKINLP